MTSGDTSEAGRNDADGPSPTGLTRRRALIAAILAGAGAGLGVSLAAGPAYGAEAWNHPFTNRKTPSRRWGYKQDGSWWPEYNDGFHKGIDYDWGGGTQIHAVAGGTVVAAGWNAYGQSWAGNAVLIRHESGWHSYYAHMSAFDVVQGQYITAGGRVGRVGTTGRSNGNHLHLEIWRTGSRGDRTDPYPLVHDAPFPGQAPAPTPEPQLPLEEEDDDMPAVIYRGGDHPPVLAIGSKFWAISEAEWNSAIAGGIPSVWLEKITLQNLISDARASKTRGAAPLILRQPGATTYIAHGGAVILRSDEEIRNLKNALGVPEMTVSQQRADIIVGDLRSGKNS